LTTGRLAGRIPADAIQSWHFVVGLRSDLDTSSTYMKALRSLALLLFIPVALVAAERPLKIDKGRSFIDVDVDATANFTAHLDAYDAKVGVDDSGKIKNAVFSFKFADLKTGKAERDAKMIEWLGGGAPQGRFELGNLALTPDGQGQASGRLIFHDVTERVEFPVNVVRADGTYVITGETTIDYRTWNLKVIRIALLLKVSPDVKIRFKLTGTPVEEAAK
jgi:polyisoprenoid-binding protein YceI